MKSLITSADQLNWITPDKLPADDCRGIDVEGAYALAVIDDDNLLAIYVDVIDDEVRVTMDRVFGDRLTRLSQPRSPTTRPTASDNPIAPGPPHRAGGTPSKGHPSWTPIFSPSKLPNG